MPPLNRIHQSLHPVRYDFIPENFHLLLVAQYLPQRLDA